MNIPSPCIHVCQLDGNDICTGCFRSRSEIARWSGMTAGEQLWAIALSNQRKSGLCHGEMSPDALPSVQQPRAR